MQSGFKGTGPETLAKFLLRLGIPRPLLPLLTSCRPLYLALLAFLLNLRDPRYQWILATCVSSSRSV